MNHSALPCLVLLLLGACATTSVDARPLGVPVVGVERGSLTTPENPIQSPSSAPTDGTGKVGTHSIHVLLGKAMLDKDDWEPVDEPLVLGLGYAREGARDPLGFELGLQIGADEETADLGFGPMDFTSSFVELAGGVRKTWLRDRVVQPYVGGGLSLINVSAEAEQGGVSVDDDDSTVGIYLHGGVMFAPGEHFEIGLDVRIVRGTDVSLFGASGDVDSEQIALVFGWNF